MLSERYSVIFFSGVGDHRNLHLLTHSFPTRRSSDLTTLEAGARGYKTIFTLKWPQNDRDFPKAGSAAFARELARSEEHTSELQSLMRISYAVFCLKKKTTHKNDLLQ